MRNSNEMVFIATWLRASLLPFVQVCTLVFISVFAVGCGGKTMPVPVSGKVTLDGVPVGGNKAAMWPARISFLPIKSGEGVTLRPAMATLDSDGKYELSTIESGDGVFPGEYNVVIISLLSGPTMMNPQAPEISEIPKHYGLPEQSGLSVTVPNQRTPLTFDFELKR